MNVAIAGAGIMGSMTAFQLTQRGHRVTLFDPNLGPEATLPHSLGSSHGRSRIVRRTYPDAFYSEVMIEGYSFWRDLEHTLGTNLLHEVGLLYFGEADDAEIVACHTELSKLGVEHQVISSSECHAMLPQFQFRASEVGVWTPEAGWVNPEQVLGTTYRWLREHGVRMNASRFEFDHATEYDAVVLVPGAWITKFVSFPVRVTLQSFVYLPIEQAGPVWIESSADFIYGFPTEELGLKSGAHRAGPLFDPVNPDRPIDPTVEPLVQSFLERRGLPQTPVTHQVSCLYTTAPNDDFLMCELRSGVFAVSPCSGHGFKFGPFLGRLLADFVEGKDHPRNWKRWHYDVSG